MALIQQARELESRIHRLEGLVRNLGDPERMESAVADLGEIQKRIGNLEGDLARVADLEARVEEILERGDARPALADLDRRLAGLETALSTLGARLARIEERLEALESRRGPTATARFIWMGSTAIAGLAAYRMGWEWPIVAGVALGVAVIVALLIRAGD